MTLPLVLKKYMEDGPFTTPEEADQQWTDIEESVNELNEKKLSGIDYEERTAASLLMASDNGKWINITSGTFDQEFSPVADLGEGWFVILHNSGAGLITLVPDASETIDSRTSYIMYPREIRLIQSDGQSLRSIVLRSFEIEFSPGVYMPAGVGDVATGTFIKPPGYSRFSGIQWGAGASGAKTNAVNTVYGGGSGAAMPFDIAADKFDEEHEFTVGVGGASVSGSIVAGNAGGNSELFPGMVCQGARAHASASVKSVGGSSLREGTTDPIYGPGENSPSLYGGQTSAINAAPSNRGINLYCSGSGGMAVSGAPTSGSVGESIHGLPGGPAANSADASPGAGRGAGGGACASANTAHQSGAGADGALLIRGII